MIAIERSTAGSGACGAIGWMLALMMGVLVPAQAAELNITAEFRPSALDPTHNRFVNTTPQSGFCAQHPALCRPGDFTINTGMNVAQRRLFGGGTDPREKWYLGADGTWQDVTVRNANNHELKARIRLFLVGLQWNVGNDGSSPGSGGAASGGCRGRTGVGNSNYYRYAWNVAANNVVCVRSPRAATDRMARLTFSIGYYLETPNPLQAQDGQYTGSVTYTVGVGQQIDLGRGNYSDSELTLNLLLNVVHDFRVQFPADSPGVQLAPEGGWSRWIDHGLPPARLRQELPFHLTTSMDFSMKLLCEHPAGTGCGIRNHADNAVVPVDVDVTIPGMTNLRDGRPAQFTALSSNDAQAPRFTPDAYLTQRRSTLRFTAEREAVTEMLRTPGSHWSGDMTVVFDANP
ncbi:hypothetical protein [Stenotrophomonas rhizophila]